MPFTQSTSLVRGKNRAEAKVLPWTVTADPVGLCRIVMNEQHTRLYCFLSNFILMLSLRDALAETFTNELRMTLKIVLHSAPAPDLLLWQFLDQDPAVHRL